MAVTATVPGQMTSKANLSNWTTATYKIALLTSLASYDQDTTDFWNDLSGSEVANGNGYTTGGQTLTGMSVSYDAATDRNRFRATAPAWTATGAGFSAVGAVIYEDTAGASSTDPIIAVINFGGTETANNGGTFTITLDATLGALYSTAA